MSGYSYEMDVEHKGLNKFRRIRGADSVVVEQKARAQLAAWEDQWQRRSSADKTRSARRQAIEERERNKEEAADRTEDAQKAIEDLKLILENTLKKNDAITWGTLYDRLAFAEVPPVPREGASAPRQPSASDPEFRPQSTILSWLVPSIRRGYEAAAAEAFRTAHERWQNDSLRHAKEQKFLADVFARQVADWEARKAAYELKQKAENEKINQFRQRYLQKEAGAILEYTDIVLARSEYPDCFPKQWNMDFVGDGGVLVVDYELPSIDVMPTLRGVKYVQSRDAFEETSLKEGEIASLYDAAMYQTCLRTIHEVFEADVVDGIRSVTFNGWVNFTDRATGKATRSCIMSVQAEKLAFQEINLAGVEPKTCFKSLKGVGSSKLAGMAAVVPVLRLSKTDARFVDGREVIDDVDLTTNIAAISWEDFEHLVREIFEKEFSSGGGEVKITRASRDGGVDAVAFDPDPIRGGKIVIQAKRYTNTVGVSAVRDLYGTVMNEGATKGILVTTSQYGPDAYEFAKGKPLTLLDGGNLLHLLGKHGHMARINLAEARTASKRS